MIFNYDTTKTLLNPSVQYNDIYYYYSTTPGNSTIAVENGP